MIPDYLWEQWESIPKYERSKWVQEKLEEEYQNLQKAQKEQALDG